MTIRITGMNSGLDTDAIVSELVSAYRAKGDKYTKAQTKLSWTQNVWKSLNTKIFNFYKSLDNFRFGGLTAKKATVSDTSKATVTASKNAVNGTQKLEVLEMAQGAYMTGGKLNELSSNPTLAELGYNGGAAAINLKGKDGEKEIKLTASSTVEDFVKQINESGTGVTAKFENGKISLLSEEGTIEMKGNVNGEQALKKLGISGGSKQEFIEARGALQIGAELTVSSLDGNTTLADLGYTNANGKIKIQLKENGTNKTDQPIEIEVHASDKLSDLQQRIHDAQPDGPKVELVLYGPTKKLGFASDTPGSNIDFEITADAGDDILDKLNLNAAGSVKMAGVDQRSAKITGTELKSGGVLEEGAKLTSGSKLSELGYGGGDGVITIKGGNGSKDIKVNSNTTISDFVKQINDSDTGVRASFDAENQRIYISSEKVGKEGAFEITGDGGNGSAALNMLKLNENCGAKLIPGSDAKIKLNGVEYTSSSNTFKINGLTIQAQGLTDGEVSVTTDTDAQGMYDKIKGLISDYNDLINEMASLYNADSSKGYEPLTADEKESMSDSEIAEWEKKIKDSLLRRDNTLGGIMSAMTTAMSISVNVNGKNYSLANLGIKTLGYFSGSKNEKNAFHIDGDSEDDNSSSNPDKLMEMLTSDPEVVEDIIKQVTSKLYSNLDAKMKSTSLRSAYTVYNDKEMAKSYSDYTTTIKEWNKKVEQIEDSYYKKFSAMETALAKLQSQMSSFTSMLG